MGILNFLFPKSCLECGRKGKYLCNECNSKVHCYGWNGDNYSIFKYQGVIRKAIISLKYKFATDIADELVDLMIQELKKINLGSGFILTPVPLHKRRENFRGFNQAELIGKKLAEKLGWRFIPDLLARNKNTVPQVGLKGFARRSNLSGVFSVSPFYTQDTRCHILIFDDVYTTGSTIKEAKKVLVNAGFKNVYSLTIAR